MARKLFKILLTYLFATSALGVEVGLEHPMLGDWNQAVNHHTGLIKIPLQNPRGHAWFAALSMGTPYQLQQICVLDNNHALSAVFSDKCTTCPSRSFDSSKSSTFRSDETTTHVVQDDGYSLSGRAAQDSMCIGMYGEAKDSHTTICMPNQNFFLVDE